MDGWFRVTGWEPDQAQVSLVMSPHTKSLHGMVFFDNLINKPVLAERITGEFLKWRLSLKWIGSETSITLG